MRSFIRALFIVLLSAGSIVLVSSCKNKCGSTTCQNGGTCTDNKCVCPTGFTGNSCETASDAATIGTYDCTKANCVPASTGKDSTWKSSITAIANNGYQVNISNFDDNNITVQASVDTANNITIVPVAGTYGVSGKGKFVNGIITLEFTTSSPIGGGYKCTMTMKKE